MSVDTSLLECRKLSLNNKIFIASFVQVGGPQIDVRRALYAKIRRCKKEDERKDASRRKQRSAFNQIFEFDRGRIVTYRDIADYLSGKSVVVLDETKQM
ncbi:hypothetical protein TNCV_1176221 [Trichonephila clavipes]|nr:hypothetical protein TNCV_1176221 [Trichonephila clavipes]